MGEIAALLISASSRPPAISWMRGIAVLYRLDIRQIQLDVIPFGVLPGAARIEWLARDGQHTPAIVAERLHGGVSDASAGTGKQQDRLGLGHKQHPLLGCTQNMVTPAAGSNAAGRAE